MLQGPHQAGRQAMASLKRGIAEKVADALQRDPDRLAPLIETGIVDRNWLEAPGERPFTHATPIDVVERFLERSVEQRPSLLANLGLSAIQILSSDAEGGEGGEGVPTRLTVAFTDLEGFTTYTATEGDDAASHLLVDHHRQVGPVVRSRGGRVVKRLGDGLLLTFPDAEAAVLACLELVGTSPDPLRLRAGAHVGEVVVIPNDVIGHVVNIAARVAEAAKGGEVLVTGDVKDDVVDDLPHLRFSRPRKRRFKGLGESVPVCKVTAAE